MTIGKIPTTVGDYSSNWMALENSVLEISEFGTLRKTFYVYHVSCRSQDPLYVGTLRFIQEVESS